MRPVEVAEGGPPYAPIEIVDTLALEWLELKSKAENSFACLNSFLYQFPFSICHLAVQEVKFPHVDAESLFSIGGVMMTARLSSRNVHIPTGNFLCRWGHWRLTLEKLRSLAEYNLKFDNDWYSQYHLMPRMLRWYHVHCTYIREVFLDYWILQMYSVFHAVICEVWKIRSWDSSTGLLAATVATYCTTWCSQHEHTESIKILPTSGWNMLYYCSALPSTTR